MSFLVCGLHCIILHDPFGLLLPGKPDAKREVITGVEYLTM